MGTDLSERYSENIVPFPDQGENPNSSDNVAIGSKIGY